MGGDNLEDKSKEKFENSGKIILDYNDFSKAKKGDYLVLSMSSSLTTDNLSKQFPNCTSTFFEKQILEGNQQRVYLRHFERTSSKLYDGKKPRIVEYVLPIKGKLELKKFKEVEVKIQNSNDQNMQNSKFNKKNL